MAKVEVSIAKFQVKIAKISHIPGEKSLNKNSEVAIINQNQDFSAKSRKKTDNAMVDQKW